MRSSRSDRERLGCLGRSAGQVEAAASAGDAGGHDWVQAVGVTLEGLQEVQRLLLPKSLAASQGLSKVSMAKEAQTRFWSKKKTLEAMTNRINYKRRILRKAAGEKKRELERELAHLILDRETYKGVSKAVQSLRSDREGMDCLGRSAGQEEASRGVACANALQFEASEKMRRLNMGWRCSAASAMSNLPREVP